MAVIYPGFGEAGKRTARFHQNLEAAKLMAVVSGTMSLKVKPALVSEDKRAQDRW